MPTLDKITEIYCIADDFRKEFAQEFKKLQMLPEDGKKHRNRSCEMSDSEIMTILLLFHFGSFKNFKHFYLHYIGVHLEKEFPKQLSYNRFVATEHRVFVPMMFSSSTSYVSANAPGSLSWIPPKSPFATTNASSETRFLTVLPRSVKVPWVGSTVSNCIWFATIKENCYPFV